MKGYYIFFFLFLPGMILAQMPSQVIRGKVIDAELKTGLEGANVIVLNSEPILGVTTAHDGTFKIQNVPVGRHSLKVSFVGYRTTVIPEILVSSGKETVITVELEEVVVNEKEVEIKASVDKDKPVDRMALVGARSFNTDESRRYAGSVDDPMRAVSNLAGVVSNAGDNSNEIMIRGNSPKGLLWRVEGVDIPNPNHFAYVGTSGGGFTIFSSQVLSNSDFYTAAFPAQYSNAISGVFDMRFRNGNNEKYETAIQAGIEGLELSSEGPFSKSHTSSYLFNYRYSILYFLQYIDPWLKNSLPSFQDLSFKLNFPTPKAGTFSFVGIGGISSIKSTPEKDSTSWNTIDDRSQSLTSNHMGAVALIHQIYLTRQSYLHSFISATYSDIINYDRLMTNKYDLNTEDSTYQKNYRFTGSITYNQKVGTRLTFRSGISYTQLFYNMDISSTNPLTGIYGVVTRGNGNTGLLLAYGETKTFITNDFEFTGGLSYSYFLLNSHYSLEPRLAIRWQINQKHALSAGYGMHSQLEDIGFYLSGAEVNQTSTVPVNKSLNFNRAQHFVLGYDFLIRQDIRFMTELYYQYLYDIPVKPGSYYSQINSTGEYFNDTLVNKGTGRNVGIDLTFEKFLTRQYYYLMTISLFDSKYKGGDGIWRNSMFNTNFVINALGGKEWTIHRKNILGLNLKASFTGGEYYVPIDLQKSILQHTEILDETNAYKPKLPDFFYLDLTITFRTNHKKFSGIWALQVRNLLNQHPNVGYIYDDFKHAIEPQSSLGIIPLISYKVEF
ncbi:MAG: TonB-dependent receptor [Bacteroidales bacterium]